MKLADTGWLERRYVDATGDWAWFWTPQAEVALDMNTLRRNHPRGHELMANDRRQRGLLAHGTTGCELVGGHAAGEPPAAWSVEGTWSIAPAVA